MCLNFSKISIFLQTENLQYFLKFCLKSIDFSQELKSYISKEETKYYNILNYDIK